jgi:uncharacterized protein YjbJ (UPF0337 family)
VCKRADVLGREKLARGRRVLRVRGVYVNLRTRGNRFDRSLETMRRCRKYTKHEIIERGTKGMEQNRNDYVTQEETGESAPIDEVEGRVEAEMKRIKGAARESVGQSMQNETVEREGRELREEGERELEEQK